MRRLELQCLLCCPFSKIVISCYTLLTILTILDNFTAVHTPFLYLGHVPRPISYHSSAHLEFERGRYSSHFIPCLRLRSHPICFFLTHFSHQSRKHLFLLFAHPIQYPLHLVPLVASFYLCLVQDLPLFHVFILYHLTGARSGLLRLKTSFVKIRHLPNTLFQSHFLTTSVREVSLLRIRPASGGISRLQIRSMRHRVSILSPLRSRLKQIRIRRRERYMCRIDIYGSVWQSCPSFNVTPNIPHPSMQVGSISECNSVIIRLTSL